MPKAESVKNAEFVTSVAIYVSGYSVCAAKF